MAQLLLMLILLQQLEKLFKAMQLVTYMPIPRCEYHKCLEYCLTEYYFSVLRGAGQNRG